VVRRLEGELAVTRSRASVAHSMRQQWGDVAEYVEAGWELMQEERDVQENGLDK
jgi:hypothetical protein